MHKILLITLLVALATSQAISLTEFSAQLKEKEERPCQDWEKNNCKVCSKGYEFDSAGNCVKILQEPVEDDEETVDFEDQFGKRVEADFIPCGGKDSCGQAETFSGKEDFDKYFKDFNSPQFFRRDFALNVATTQAQPAAAPAAGRDFSGTNNQQGNVDEADLLKTDGTYIYTVSNGVLSIVLAYPSRNARVLSEVDVAQLHPTALFIEGDYLALFGTKYDYYGYGYRYSGSYTFIKIYNIKNRANPFEVKEYRLAGNYFNGRKTSDGFVYILSTHYFNRYEKPLPWFDLDGKVDFIPYNRLFYFPGKYNYPVFVSILSFNLGNPLSKERGFSCLITQSAQTLYMSENAIYITYSDYNGRGADTVIHKIFVRRNRIIPFADGRVAGTVNNQFSLDEYGWVLRVATTYSEWNGRQTISYSIVHCLDYHLNQFGILKNIAPGQRIFSARYVGLRLYLVTFRQIDPFFVISLRNHRRPKILGELKIPGFSRYLHPYDEHTVIGLGRQADANTGRQLGLKISIFDVSDVRRPREAASFELAEKYASSSAEWEHKAFLFSKSKNLLVIPASLSSNELKFNGAFAFYVDSSTILLRGLIDHFSDNDGNQFWRRNVERSLYIEQLLYTKSQCLLRINRIYDLKGVKDLKLECNKKTFPIDPYPFPIGPPIRIDPILTPLPVVRQVARQPELLVEAAPVRQSITLAKPSLRKDVAVEEKPAV